MFGTFQAEEERPTYGITKPINSWNAVWANFSHYAVMADEIKQIPSFTDKIKYLFKKPGWLPASMGGYRPAPEIDKQTYSKYNPAYPMQLNYYVLFQYVLCLGVTAFFLFKQSQFTLGEKTIVSIVVSIWVVNCGVLFEAKKWIVVAEWIRMVLFTVLGGTCIYLFDLPVQFYFVALAYGMVSVVWFYSISNLRNEKVSVV